jgi:hypothetical protein
MIYGLPRDGLSQGLVGKGLHTVAPANQLTEGCTLI